MNKKIPEDAIHDIAVNWDRIEPHKHNKIVQELADYHGIHFSSVYRCIRQYRERGCKTMPRKSCCGIPRKCSREEKEYYVKIIMGLKTYHPLKPDNRIPNANKTRSTARAIEIAENMGLIPKGLLNARTVNRWAKELDLTPKQICKPRPAVKTESLHPNHVFVIDFSVCDQFYLRDSDGKIISRTYTYKNKPNEAREKIWAFALVDHYSGVVYLQYFLSPGESIDILNKGLIAAMSKKDDSQFPFHGAPKIFYCDKGSALLSQKNQNFAEALGIKIIPHKPGNPRAKGMVESFFRYLQNDFESDLLLCPAQTIDELNARAYNWMLARNWKSRTGKSKSPFEIWQGITNEQLMVPPPIEILRKCVSSYETRTVDAYCTISLYNEKYGVPAELCGKKVRVWNNIDGGISVQDIETGDMFETCEQRTTVFGEYNAFPKTEQQRRQDEALKMAGEIRKEITPDMLRREIPNLHAIPRAGTPIDVDSDLVKIESDCYESVYKAKCAIADELRINLGDLPGWMLDEIEGALAITLDKEKVHDIAEFTRETLRQMRDVG